MSDESIRKRHRRPGKPSREAGAAAVEYLILLGLITAMVIGMIALLYPGAGRDIESLVNAWGDRLAAIEDSRRITPQNFY